jgi:hypothetical protein
MAESPSHATDRRVSCLERIVLTARLRPDAYERAEELASIEPSGGPGQARLRSITFLSPSEVVFMVEGDDVDLHTREWFDDPVLSSAFSSWVPLFDGPLHRAREVASWNWPDA